MSVNSFSLPFSLSLSIFMMCMGAPVFFSRWAKYPRFKFTIHVSTCPERGDDDHYRVSTNDRNAEEQWRQLMSGHRVRFFFQRKWSWIFLKRENEHFKIEIPSPASPPPAKKLFKYHSNAAVDDLLLYFLKTVNLHTLLLYNIRFC